MTIYFESYLTSFVINGSSVVLFVYNSFNPMAASVAIFMAGSQYGKARHFYTIVLPQFQQQQQLHMVHHFTLIRTPGFSWVNFFLETHPCLFNESQWSNSRLLTRHFLSFTFDNLSNWYLKVTTFTYLIPLILLLQYCLCLRTPSLVTSHVNRLSGTYLSF